jgi:hypothetical protein
MVTVPQRGHNISSIISLASFSRIINLQRLKHFDILPATDAAIMSTAIWNSIYFTHNPFSQRMVGP